MEANVGDLITFTYYPGNYDINVASDIGLYSGSMVESTIVFKAYGYCYVMLPTKSGLGLMHKVDSGYITKVITPYNKLIEGL
jgi:hypothetical protein